MLNKNAEKVLKCIIKKSDNKLNKKITLSISDFKKSKFTVAYINSVCEELARKRYIKNLILDEDCNYGPTLYLTHEGFSYFEIRKIKLNSFWLKNAWIPIIVSFLTYVLLNCIIPMLLGLLKCYLETL